METRVYLLGVETSGVDVMLEFDLYWLDLNIIHSNMRDMGTKTFSFIIKCLKKMLQVNHKIQGYSSINK